MKRISYSNKISLLLIIFIIGLIGIALSKVFNHDLLTIDKSAYFQYKIFKEIGLLSVTLIFSIIYGIDNGRKRILNLLCPACLILLALLAIEFFPLSIGNNLIALFALSCIAIAFFEEYFFRSFIYNFIQNLENPKTKIYKSAIVTSILFGLVHIINIGDMEPKISVINQIVSAFGIGFLFQSIYVYYNNILPTVVLHAIINYFGSYNMYLNEHVASTIPSYSTVFTSFLLILIIVFVILLPLGSFILKMAAINSQYKSLST